MTNHEPSPSRAYIQRQLAGPSAPPGATHWARGLFYKRGRFDRWFYHNNHEWLLSGVSPLASPLDTPTGVNTIQHTSGRASGLRPC